MDCKSLLRLAKIFAAHKGLTPTTVSSYITGSGDTFTRLELGRTMTVRRLADLFQKFSDQWPSNAAWPSDIPRPEPSASSGDPAEVA